MKRLFKLLIWLALFFSLWMWWSLRPVGTIAKGPVTVVIQSGDSLATITEALLEAKVIRSSVAFRLYGRMTGAASTLKTGAYKFTGTESASEILDILEDGRITVSRVTIPEGLTVAQIDQIMAGKGLGKPGDIVHCAFTCDFSTFNFLPQKNFGTEESGYGSKLEGYLFPETYSISSVEYVPKFFLEQMLGEFRRRVVRKFEADIVKSKRSLSDITIMASLVEEESRKDEERAIIAGILWKRLDNRVVLGVDATTRYQFGKITAPLTKAELESDHSYNTRRKQGLPPTPIANAGEPSFIAALRPTSSEYWYYLHAVNGMIHFAITNDEHNVNKAKYIR